MQLQQHLHAARLSRQSGLSRFSTDRLRVDGQQRVNAGGGEKTMPDLVFNSLSTVVSEFIKGKLKYGLIILSKRSTSQLVDTSNDVSLLFTTHLGWVYEQSPYVAEVSPDLC